MVFDLDWSECGNDVIATYNSELDGESILRSTQSIISDARFSDIKSFIHNLSSVQNLNMNTQEIQQLGNINASMHKKHPSIKLAVVSDKALVKGLFAMHSAYYSMNFDINNDDWDIKLFKTIDEAKKWTNCN